MELRTFAERVFWARRNYAKMTQQVVRDRMEAEHEVEIGRNYLSQIENGEGAKPSFEVVRAMAAVLEVSMDFLAGFTENHTPVQGEGSTPPHYFTPEADEVAQLMDAMKPEQRNVMVNVARSLATPTERQRERAEARDIIESVERQYGRDVRIALEKAIRDKWASSNPTP